MVQPYHSNNTFGTCHDIHSITDTVSYVVFFLKISHKEYNMSLKITNCFSDNFKSKMVSAINNNSF